MIRIELTGTDTASGCNRTIKTTGKASAIPKLCRQLIDDGYAAHDQAHIYRNGTLCFDSVALSWWAARDVVEGDAHPARVQKHKPFDAGAVFSVDSPSGA